MLTIGRLGHGSSAADYYVDRQAGCDLDYYTEPDGGEPRGVWCGSAVPFPDRSPVLDEAGELRLRNLLAGRDVAGGVLVGPVMRGDPRGRLPAAALVRAVEGAAAARGVEPVQLFAAEDARVSFGAMVAALEVDARVPRRPRASVAVDAADRLAVAAGLDPVEVFRGPAGEDRFARAERFATGRVDVRRSGLDLTFSAPKSVSVLFGLGDPRVVAQVRAAHQVAVAQTIEYLEGLCARAARGHHTPGEPQRRIPTSGWAAVAFEHRSSRSGDPQLHTHVVVPNLVCGVDGKWSAWDTSEAYRQATTGGYLYQAVLRAELTRRLGVQWGPVRHGVAEVRGVPTALRRVFSQRRRAIEDHLEDHGRSGAKAAQIAALATRPAKQHATDAELRTQWRITAITAGFVPDTVIRDATQRPAMLPLLPAPTVAAVAPRVLGVTGVTARSSSFDRRALLRAVCEAVPAGSPVDVPALRALATQLIRDPQVVPLLTDTPVGTRSYSTTDLLVTEATALQQAQDRTADGVAHLDPATVDAAVAVSALSTSQADAVTRMLTSGCGVEVVVGPAGSGKTAALRTAHDVWRAAGVEVRGTAIAAIAAKTLQDGTGIPSQSLTRLTRAINGGDTERGLPARGGVLIVDEAGMVGTRDLHQLIETTRQGGVKLVLVGDPLQLPEIDAGGLFTHLTQRLPTSTLAGNVRQRHPWEQQALVALRDGDVLTAVDAYDSAGRLHLTEDPAAARTAIITDYLTARQRNGSVVMLTSRRVDTRILNGLTRHALIDRGDLGGDTLTVRVGSRTVEWRVGDAAVVTSNDYPLGLINGTRATVTGLSTAGLTVTADGVPIPVPIERLERGVLEYGYALTCHKAQGITVDVALLFASVALTREAGYVGMSRGRNENHLYSTLDALLPEVDADLDQRGEDPIPDQERLELTRAAVVHRLDSRSTQRLALDQTDPSVRGRIEEMILPNSAAGDGRYR